MAIDFQTYLSEITSQFAEIHYIASCLWQLVLLRSVNDWGPSIHGTEKSPAFSF